MSVFSSKDVTRITTTIQQINRALAGEMSYSVQYKGCIVMIQWRYDAARPPKIGPIQIFVARAKTLSHKHFFPNLPPSP